MEEHWNNRTQQALHFRRWALKWWEAAPQTISPWKLASVVLVEAPVMLLAEPLHELEHRRGALLDGERRPLASHVGLHPPRVEAHHQDAVVLEVEAQRPRHGVQRGLARSVGVETALVVLGNGSQHRAHVDDDGALLVLGRLLQLGQQGLCEHHGGDRIGGEVLHHLLHFDEVHPGELGGHAGVVDEQVEAVILDDGLDLLGEIVVAFEVGHVYLQNVNVLVLRGDTRQGLGLLRVSASGDEVFRRLRPLNELLYEAEAQAAVAPRDENRLHFELTSCRVRDGTDRALLGKITSLAVRPARRLPPP